MKNLLLIIISAVLILNIFIPINFASSTSNISRITAGSSITFSDLSNSHWAYKNIMNLVSKGVINGYTDGTYKPEKAVTRGEFLKLIMVALYGDNEYFEKIDFSKGHWALSYAMEALREGYMMNGTSVSKLNDYITRKEMIHILAKICSKNMINKQQPNSPINFMDENLFDEETKIYVDFVTSNGLINGYTDGTIKVENTMTRAEVATVMVRFLDLRS